MNTKPTTERRRPLQTRLAELNHRYKLGLLTGHELQARKQEERRR